MAALRSVLVGGTFVVVLGGGALAQFGHLDATTALDENRTKATFPRLNVPGRTVPNFTRDVDRWFSDNFHLRNTLVRINSRIRNRGLDTPSSLAVVFGTNGWLYYTADSSLWFARRANPFAAAEIDRIADVLEQRTRSLAALGSVYLVMVAPNPATIYPEHEPQWLQRTAPGPSRFDQLVAAASARKTFAVVDPRASLFAAKAASPGVVYRPTDTHWNDRGAYVGYCALMLGLAQSAATVGGMEIPAPLPLDSFSVTPTDTTGGDLATMLGLADRYRERLDVIAPLHSRLANAVPADRRRPDFTTAWRGPASRPRVLVFRDSYFSAMLPFFAESFARVRYVLGPYRESIVAEEKPDIVIEELVERFLGVARFTTPP
jgi:alginate O-acetyltransferase complex protein AlgJ